MTSSDAKARALLDVLQKLPPYTGPVFRGTNLPPEVIDRYQPGVLVTELAFTSTTTDVASEFPVPVEYEIFSRAGRDISQFSADPSEREVLFPTFTTFEVIGRTTEPDTGRTSLRLVDSGWLGHLDASRRFAGKIFSTPDDLGPSYTPVPPDWVTEINRTLGAAHAARSAVPPEQRIVRGPKFWDELGGTEFDPNR